MTLTAIVGAWVGEYHIKDKQVFMRIHFRGKKIGGTIDILEEGLFDTDLTHTKIEDSHIHFELPKNAETLIFDGQIENGTISGICTQAEEKGTFSLARVAKAGLKTFEKFLGVYHLESGRRILFGWRFNTLCYLEGRRIVQVYPLSETRGFSERGETVTFGKEGVSFVSSEGETSGKKTIPYTEEDVTFSRGDVTLSGILALPSGPRPYPAVVLIHGSGAETREGYRFLADHLASHGIAALRYDKRGTGASTGDWCRSTLEDLAEDAVAGVHFLQTRTDIDPEKIGLIGTSQGGWVVPMAASRSEDVAFCVLISGAAVSPQNQELYRVKHELQYQGLSPAHVSLHVLMYRLQLLLAKILQVVEKVVPLSQVLSGDLAFALHLAWDLDPAPILEQVTCPVGVWSEIPRLEKKEFVPGYYDLISNWILERVD